jgi:multicomponent Na+:H+ antiporter subunit E
MSFESATAGQAMKRAWVWRWAGYFAFWVLLIGYKPLDLAVGLVAATTATWASQKLLPPGSFGIRASDLPRYFVHFLWQSVVAGIDVARRAFSPQIPLHPGYVRFVCRYPQGPARNAFASLTSLMPGTVPVEDASASLLYHCLDTRQPIAEQLAREEVEVSRLLTNEPRP